MHFLQNKFLVKLPLNPLPKGVGHLLNFSFCAFLDHLMLFSKESF